MSRKIEVFKNIYGKWQINIYEDGDFVVRLDVDTYIDAIFTISRIVDYGYTLLSYFLPIREALKKHKIKKFVFHSYTYYKGIEPVQAALYVQGIDWPAPRFDEDN